MEISRNLNVEEAVTAKLSKDPSAVRPFWRQQPNVIVGVQLTMKIQSNTSIE